MKKLVRLSFILLAAIILVTGCNSYVSDDYQVLELSQVEDLPDVYRYVMDLQESTPEVKGYKIFEGDGERKIIVIASGQDEKAIKIRSFHQSSKDTAITFRQVNLPTEQQNAYLIVQLEEIIGAFFVKEEVDYDEIK
ncbi:hypothetical protein [Pseudalkalibacillus sp. SCS-8]|uniref:hypothetical protein n=1 Tax=Pseudalkalibacillus nanhaiensis TaxID=3115291 RepID=UPI0032DBBD5F